VIAVARIFLAGGGPEARPVGHDSEPNNPGLSRAGMVIGLVRSNAKPLNSYFCPGRMKSWTRTDGDAKLKLMRRAMIFDE